MKKLTYLLAISILGLASAANALASQDAGTHASRMDAAVAARMVKTSYVPPALGQSAQVSMGAPVNEAAKSVADEKPLTDDLPQNGALTLLAGLAIIVVIGKRKLSS